MVAIRWIRGHDRADGQRAVARERRATAPSNSLIIPAHGEARFERASGRQRQAMSAALNSFEIIVVANDRNGAFWGPGGG